MRLNIQLFGGRGASSSYGQEGYTTGGSDKPLTFYDKTETYKGLSVQDFEKRVGKFKNEYIGLYDDKGKIIIAGTSYNEGAVAIPTTHPKFKSINQMTHTHPADGRTRTLGGSLSGADVQNTAILNFKGVRAYAREKTYILRRIKGAKANNKKLFKVATLTDRTWDRNAKIRVNKIEKALGRKGKKISAATKERIYLGYGTRYWKRSLQGTGYEYVEIRSRNR